MHAMMVVRARFTLLSVGLAVAAASSTSNLRTASTSNFDSGCDDSSPLAHPSSTGEDRRLVAIPRCIEEGGMGSPTVVGKYYENGEYYAPLCDDGMHVDTRTLYQCTGGSCFNEFYNVSSRCIILIHLSIFFASAHFRLTLVAILNDPHNAITHQPLICSFVPSSVLGTM